MHIFLNMLSVVQSFGHWGYLIAFLFAFTESLALVGGFIPGSTAVIILGFMTANGYLDPVIMSVLVVMGAILGDSVSYWLGTKGTHLFKDENKILKSSHLEIGKKFFQKHGDKSIFLGRFVGVIRPMIPFAAGLSKMKQSRFLFWNILSGIIWGVSHVYIGYFFGASLKLIEAFSKRLAIFIVLSLVSIFIIWFIAKMFKGLFVYLNKSSKNLLSKILSSKFGGKFFTNYPKLSSFIVNRFSTETFYGQALSISLTMLSVFVFLFALVADGVLDNSQLVSLDQRISGFLYYFRDPYILKVSFWISLLGNSKIVILYSVIFILILLLWNRRHLITTFIISVAGSTGLAGLIKLIVERPRPDGVLPVYYESMSSFPSGHSVIAVALYGFIFYVISKYLLDKKKHFIIVFFGSIVLSIILAIGFSRIYLGVHYFSDVLAGYAVGLIGLIISLAVAKWLDSRKKETANIPEQKMKWIKSISYFLTFLAIFGYIVYGVFIYKPQMVNESYPAGLKVFKNQNLNSVFLINEWSNSIEGVSGEERAPINFVFWTNDYNKIITSFKNINWSVSDDPSVKSLFRLTKNLAIGQSYDTIPLLPYFWDNIPNDYSFEKNINISSGGRERQQVRLWKTTVINESGQNLYIGSLVVNERKKMNPFYQPSKKTEVLKENMCQIFSSQAGILSQEVTVDSGSVSTSTICEIKIK